MARKTYPLDFNTRFGVATMGVSQTLGTSIVTGVLMLFLTDYAGLFTGIPGAAAAAAATMLVVGRVWDAINDPVLGFVMDRSPRTRWGRFKPFLVVSIPLSTILLVALFNLPLEMDDVAKLVLIYVLYLLFDTVFTLMPFSPLLQTLSPDPVVRSKLLGPFRIVSLIGSVAMAGFIPVALAFGPDGGFGIASVLFLVPATLLSLAGILLVKEGNANIGEETVRVRDVLRIIRTNKPFWITALAMVVQGFTWTLLYAGSNYYVKYALGVDAFAVTAAVLGVATILGNILGVPISQAILKRVTPGQGFLIVNVATAVPFLALFLLNLAGPITNPIVLFTGLFLAALAIGAAFIPGSVMGYQVMDFNRFRTGKTMQGTISSFMNFIQKLQAAVGAAATGAILVAVGYDAELFEQAETLPAALFGGLGLVIFGLPALAALGAAGISWWFPLRRRAAQDEMYAAIEAAKAEAVGDTAEDAEGAVTR
ncbi:MAG: hypothetical protein EAS51_10505 [Microbacteriaceae bacterium]|nr:MAG: hypothetical protein EAS51_10505 [Microbacteriaceae bacterium]